MAKRSAKKLGSARKNQWLKILASPAAHSENGDLRVLIDTNVWYSAILYGGQPEKVVRICKHNCRIISSHYLIDEILSKLKQLKAPYRWRNDLERTLKRICSVIEPPDFAGISRDPKDDPIVAAAIAGQCDFLITNDKDLLELGGYKQMLILKPIDLLKVPVIKKLDLKYWQKTHPHRLLPQLHRDLV